MSEVPLYEEEAQAHALRHGLVFKAHRRVYHSTLGLIVIADTPKF